MTRRLYATPPARAFDGQGAARSVQRWNAKGTPVAYASQSMSLAALEYLGTLVDIADAPTDLVSVVAEFDEALVEIIDVARVPGWNTIPPTDSVSFGTEWARQRRSVVLRVPSVMIPSESNFVFNPDHPDFARGVQISDAESFAFDPRLR